MSIRLQDSRLQALVEQMTQSGRLGEAQVKELVDAAYADDGRLSGAEKRSLQSLLQEHGDLFDSGEARDKLSSFQAMSNATLRDAAHRFAADGTISQAEARSLQGLALESNGLSGNEKVTLKALMGFYSPELEPGARELVEHFLEPGDAGAAEASQEATALHGALAGDGQITLTELTDTEAELAATHGPDKAKEILLTALGVDPSKISFEAVDYLQGKFGSMDGHIDRFQQVLSHHLKDARLLDANFDGKLDENDLVFRKDAQGQVQVQTIGKALSDRVRVGAAMVDAAHDMSKAKHRFGDLEANPVVWEIDEDDPDVMHLNSEFSPSVALMDIFNNPELYQFECATAMVILRYKAMLDLIGEKDFDRICPDLRIGIWRQEDHAEGIWKISGSSNGGPEVDMSPEDKASLRPGDYAYFKNWDVSEAAFKGGWQGENVIYLGDDKYYGHPFRITTGEKIVSYLNKHRNAGSTRSASLLDLKAEVSSEVLSFDEDPTG